MPPRRSRSLPPRGRGGRQMRKKSGMSFKAAENAMWPDMLGGGITTVLGLTCTVHLLCFLVWMVVFFGGLYAYYTYDDNTDNWWYLCAVAFFMWWASLVCAIESVVGAGGVGSMVFLRRFAPAKGLNPFAREAEVYNEDEEGGEDY